LSPSRSLGGVVRRIGAARAVLLAGVAALCLPPGRWGVEPLSWESLLAPYSRGAPLPEGFRIDAIRRGSENDVVILAGRSADAATVEVHVLQRGRWAGVRESQSYGIGYETPRSTAAARESVTEAIAQAIRSRDRGLPSPDAIPLGPSFDPSALPWWLEMQRGWRGVLVGASLLLLALMAVVRSPGLTAAAVALGAIAVMARAAGLPYGHPDIGGAWVVPAAALLFLVALRRRHAAAREDRRLVLAIGAFALFLRLALGPWGPLHVNGYGPRFVAGAAREPAAIASYGPGYVELFGPIAAFAPASPDWAIFGANALLSAFAATLAFVLGRLIGIPRRAAAAAALLLAIDPVAIRMAATESYFPSIIFLCVAAGAALAVAATEIGAGAGWRAAAWLAGGGLLLVEAARIHPSAWVPVATVPFVALAGDTGGSRARAVAFVAGVTMIGGLMLATSGSVLLDVLGNVRGGMLIQPSAPVSLRPLAWIGAAALGYAVLARRPWLAVAAGIAAAGMVLTRHVYGQSWIWQQSYDRLFITLPVLVAGAISASALRYRGLAAVLALLVLVAWFRFALPIVSDRTTDHLEYRWLRERLRGVPSHCRVIHPASVANRGVEIPTYVRPPSAPAVAMHERRPHTIAAGLAAAPCLYYVRTSVCSSVDGRPGCEAIESRLVLAPVSRASFPSRPSSVFLAYDSDPVEIVIARVDRIDGASR
jgi:hypothetical protein